MHFDLLCNFQNVIVTVVVFVVGFGIVVSIVDLSLGFFEFVLVNLKTKK